MRTEEESESPKKQQSRSKLSPGVSGRSAPALPTPRFPPRDTPLGHLFSQREVINHVLS